MYIYNNDNGRWMDYTVTDTDNIFNGYVKDSKGCTYEFTRDNDYYCQREVPTYYTRHNIYPCGKRKPSIYKRPFLSCTKDEYRHISTNIIRKTTEEVHDVYKSRRNKIIDKVTTNIWYSDTYLPVY